MIEIDISEVKALTREAERSLERQQPAEVKRILDRAARTERRTHLYQNRTGDLEASTFAGELQKTDDGFEVEFGARMSYASFVDNRGLTRVNELAQQAENEIEFYLDGEAERLGTL